ncbi:MAG: cupin domain-containing protein [Deltaproteobacteria bacterium]|nr:cupin domain-containing protein [Deltaproteobacteria bacterium]
MVNQSTTMERLACYEDDRGVVFEPIEPMELRSQQNVHLVLTQPGKIRGNHYHGTGTEVVVLVGPAFARIHECGETKDIIVPEGDVVRFVIPPGIPHAFQNTGTDVMILLAFNTVAHDRAHPDTFPCILIGETNGKASSPDAP